MGIGAGEVYSPAAREPERLNARNYRITSADRLGAGSLKQKAQDNFAAIELVRRLVGETRPATDEERHVLVKYVGWGGIPQVFADFGPEEWQPERDRLKTLLTPEQYEAARASTLNAHYTGQVPEGTAAVAALRRWYAEDASAEWDRLRREREQRQQGFALDVPGELKL